MPITFDRKGFRKTAKNLKKGKKHYALRLSMIGSIFNALLSSFFIAFVFEKSFNVALFLISFFFIFLFTFIADYFVYLTQWKLMIDNYNETIDYWEKHDPTFFEGTKYDKIEENVPNLSKSKNF